MKQTAVEWLAEKYNYITWMRNRDEMSAGTADEWRAKYLEQAKEMFEEQIKDAIIISEKEHIIQGNVYPPQFVVDKAKQYYKQKYGGNK
jgi:hypothetical protein